MKQKVTIGLLAAFGGVVSNLIEVAMGLQADPVQVPVPTYWLGCVIWAGCGAVVALAWGETSLKKAVYIGMGLPSLLQLGVTNLSAPDYGEGHAMNSMGSGLVSVAHAQPGNVNVAGRTLDIRRGANAPQGSGYEVVFYKADGSIGSAVTVVNGAGRVNVPSSAARVAMKYRGARSKVLSLPTTPDANQVITVTVKRSRWSGFFRALGNKSARRYIVEIRAG